MELTLSEYLRLMEEQTTTVIVTDEHGHTWEEVHPMTQSARDFYHTFWKLTYFRALKFNHPDDKNIAQAIKQTNNTARGKVLRRLSGSKYRDIINKRRDDSGNSTTHEVRATTRRSYDLGPIIGTWPDAAKSAAFQEREDSRSDNALSASAGVSRSY